MLEYKRIKELIRNPLFKTNSRAGLVGVAPSPAISSLYHCAQQPIKHNHFLGQFAKNTPMFSFVHLQHQHTETDSPL